MRLVELVPNISEGRDPAVVAAIADAMRAVPGCHVLDVSSDASHHRSVITAVAPADAAVDAAFACVAAARDRIDLTRHRGAHPRIGACDVVPFVPLEGTTMADCIALARALGARVGAELGIPVYLYERAATRSARENLADVRRGEFEGLRDAIAADPDRAPDFGPAAVHPTAGAVAIGARPFLVAYNIYLGDRSNLPVAKEVAKAVRGSSGGLRHVKGLGLEVDGQAQVSLNLVDTDRTPLHVAYDLVATEARARAVEPTWSEIVGLVPERVLFDAAARYLRLRRFSPEQVLERQVRRAAQGGESLAGFVASVATATPTPGGGSVAALAGALAAALAQMVAGLTVGRQKDAAVDARMRALEVDAAALGAELQRLVAADAAAYRRVTEAARLPDEPAAARRAALAEALLGAALVPLETARACARVALLAAEAAESGNVNAVSDAGVAALLAEAAARGAAYNVRINVASFADPMAGRGLVEEARSLVQECAAHAARATAAVEQRL